MSQVSLVADLDNEGPHDGEDIRVVSSISKAFAVFEALTSNKSGVLGVSEIALAVHLPKSTTHRLLQELEVHGFVAHAGRKYQVGGRLFELVSAADRSVYGRLRDIAAPALEALLERTGLTVHLAVLDGGDVLIVDRIRDRHGSGLSARTGTRLPAPCTALGKVMVAFSTPQTITAVARSMPRKLTGYSIVDPGVLISELREIRRTAVANEHEEAQIRVESVACPVLVNGRAVAAISLSGSIGALNSLTHGRLVTDAALSVGRHLATQEEGSR